MPSEQVTWRIHVGVNNDVDLPHHTCAHVIACDECGSVHIFDHLLVREINDNGA